MNFTLIEQFVVNLLTNFENLAVVQNYVKAFWKHNPNLINILKESEDVVKGLVPTELGGTLNIDE